MTDINEIKVDQNIDQDKQENAKDKYFAMTDNFGESNTLHEIIDITYHRTIKG